MTDPKMAGLVETLQHRLPSNGWTTETVLQHVLGLYAEANLRYEQRFDALEGAMTRGFESQRTSVISALSAAERATTKAETAAERRFEGVNEFRAALADQQRTLMPRAETTMLIHAQSEKISALQKQVDALVTERVGIRGGYGYAVGVVGFVLTILSAILILTRFGLPGN